MKKILIKVLMISLLSSTLWALKQAPEGCPGHKPPCPEVRHS